MDNFRRTIDRREKLIEFAEKRLGEVLYNNHPIGYCWNDGCTSYRSEWHETMKEGMLAGIAEIEKALVLIKKSIEYSNE